MDMAVIKLACAVGEMKDLALGEVTAVLDRDNEVEFLVLEVLGKNN